MKDYRTKPQLPDPETAIEWEEMHDTHRVGFYRDWMIVQPYDYEEGGIRCYLPSDEWEGASFPDLDYLQDYYTPEWAADNLYEVMDFINDY